MFRKIASITLALSAAAIFTAGMAAPAVAAPGYCQIGDWKCSIGR